MNGTAAVCDDIRLLSQARNGDGKAFGVLAERHRNRLYRFILKNVRCPVEARDLTQESLLQAYRSLGSFNGSARFSTWLTGIALNLTRNHLNRGPQRFFVENGEEDLSGMSSSRDDPFFLHQRNTEMAALADAISGLPADMRECLVLVALEGYSYEEAAQLLDVPVGTVKSRICRARQKLREELGAQGFFN